MAGPLVVGYDGTDGAHAALREAGSLARALGAPVVVAFGYGPSPLGGEVADMASALREYGGGVVDAAVRELRESGVDARAELVDDRPAAALAHLADRLDARMIVIGSYGERPITGIILGSVPHRLLHLTKRPVLVVHA